MTVKYDAVQQTGIPSAPTFLTSPTPQFSIDRMEMYNSELGAVVFRVYMYNPHIDLGYTSQVVEPIIKIHSLHEQGALDRFADYLFSHLLAEVAKGYLGLER